MHLAAFRFQHEEMRRTLAEMAAAAVAKGRWDPSMHRKLGPLELANRIVGQSLMFYDQHVKKDLKSYLDDEDYRGLVMQMIEVCDPARPA